MQLLPWLLCAVLTCALPARGERLVVATYNVENYTLADRQTPDGFRPAYPKPEDAKRALRGVIRALDADVLALQEMGGRAFLDELRRDLASEGMAYAHAEILEAGDEPRYVAVLSRRPFTRVVRHTDLGFRYLGADEVLKRGLLEVRLAAPDGELTLFVAHLKSRFTERKDDPQSALRRAGEAQAVRDRILARFPEPASASFLLVGDFNDGPASRPVRALLRRGATEICVLLPAADSRGETWTHRYRREDSYTRVDHVFASKALVPQVRGGGGRIHDGPGTADASDHRPVVVELVWP
jgi:endonuclease/exonuclease/phosphatase family metal-dependent hydrolase